LLWLPLRLVSSFLFLFFLWTWYLQLPIFLFFQLLFLTAFD
jgi:hypothetical protein